MDVNESWGSPFGDEQIETDLGEDNPSELKNFLSLYCAASRPVDHKARQPTIRRSAPRQATHDDTVIRA